MKTKEQILTEHARANGLRLNDSDWGDWLLQAMDIYAAQEVERVKAIHDKETTYLIAKIESRDLKIKELKKELRELQKFMDDPEAMADYISGM